MQSSSIILDNKDICCDAKPTHPSEVMNESVKEKCIYSEEKTVDHETSMLLLSSFYDGANIFERNSSMYWPLVVKICDEEEESK